MNPNGFPPNMMRGQPMGFMGMQNGQMPPQHQQQMQQAQLQQAQQMAHHARMQQQQQFGQQQINQQQLSQQQLNQQQLNQQLNAQVERHLQLSLQHLPAGWKQEVPLGERRGYILEIISGLRVVKPDVTMPLAFNQALKNEQTFLQQSPDKAAYVNQIQSLLSQFRLEREKNAQRMSMAMGAHQNMGQNMGQNVGQNMGQNMNQSMGQNLGQNQRPAGQAQDMRLSMSNNGQPVPTSFNPQLRAPMQASPIPGSAQNNAANAGTVGNGLPQMQQQMAKGMAQGQPQMTPASVQQRINQVANQLMQRHNPQNMEVILAKWNQMPQEKRNAISRLQSNAASAPLQWYYSQEAKHIVFTQISSQRAQASGMQPNGAVNGMMPGQNHQQNMQQQMINGQQRIAGGFPGQDMDYTQFLGQQAEAIQSANSGQTVVPASNNPPLSQALGNMGMMMGQNNNFPGQGPAGQMSGPGMGLRPPSVNPQANQLQAQVMQAQNNQRLAQQMQNRPQAMNMAGQMSSQPGMPLLTQAVGQNQPPQMQNGPSRPQSTQGINPGMQQPQQPQQPPPGAQMNHAGLMQQNRPGQPNVMPDHMRQMMAQQQSMARLGQQPGQMPANPGQPGIMGQPAANRMMQGVPLPAGMMPNAPANRQNLQQNIPQHVMTQLDLREFPPSFLHANGIPQTPPHVRTWGQLKNWLVANKQSVPGLDMGRVLMAQISSYRNNNAQTAGASGMQMPGNNVPTGPPGAQPMLGQMGMGQAMQMPRVQVTSQEIQNLRDQLQRSGSQPKTEEEIRNFLIARKHQSLQTMLQQQQQKAKAGNNGAMIAGQINAGANAGQPGPLAQQNPGNQPPAGVMTKTPQLPQAAQAGQQAPNMRKRPSNDGADANVPVISRGHTPQVSGKGANRVAMVNQQAQAALGTAAQSSPATAGAQVMWHKLKHILAVTRGGWQDPPPRPAVSPPMRAQYEELIRNNLEVIKGIDTAIKVMYLRKQNDEELQEWFRDRFTLNAQFDIKTIHLKELTFVDLEELRSIIVRFASFVEESRTNSKQNATADGLQAKLKQEETPQATSSPKAGRMSAAAARNSAKTPVAPTADRGQKSFFPSGVQSPQGVPTYLGPSVPMTEIKIPPSKKQKRQASVSIASPQTTGTAASPMVTKQTPEAKPSPVGPAKEAPKAKPFECDEKSCQSHLVGFDTKAELEDHKKVHFVFPADPIKYAEDSVAAALGLNPDGSAKSPTQASGKTAENTEAGASTPASVKSAIKTSPSITLLKGAKDTKVGGPTSAPKAESKIVQGLKFEDEGSTTVISPMVMNDIFDLDTLSGLDFPSMPSTLDSSPSALTPSSSRGSSSSTSLDKNGDILGQDKLKVQIAVDSGNGVFGDDKDTVMYSLDDFNAELANGDLSNLGIYTTSFDGDVSASVDPSMSLFADQFTADENGDKFLDLDVGDWTSDSDFAKLLAS